MSLTQEQFERLHTTTVRAIEDATSRFSFEVECTCGVRGLFYDENDAKLYEDMHLKRKSLRPY